MKQKHKDKINQLPTETMELGEWKRQQGMLGSELRRESSERSKRYGLLKFLRDNPVE